ncbi:MAG: alcohol dehydrogenase, class [Lachnospiraceae bacterium]|jgi:alcohol dehydrogenase class IV|nr:alcohol dehydrogenase, class [Lachnospiraceae bacterium]
MKLSYYMPTKVIMGSECIVNNKEVFQELGSKAMIVTGAKSAKVNGSEQDVVTALKAVGIEYILYDKVMSNPTIECAYEGARLAKENGVNFIISIGGGSPMDAGKVIALLACQDIKEENLFSGKYENKILPMVHIPTTAGTGSEVTPFAVLTNNKAQTKMSIGTPLIFPTIAFLDAKYTKELSKTITINTAIDALSHAIEGMISNKSSELTNGLAEQSIKTITECIPSLNTGNLSMEEREKLLYASMVAGVVIAHTKTTAVHAMGYSLTYYHDIDHGRANGLLLGEFMTFTAKSEPELIRRILNAMNLNTIEDFNQILDQLLGEKETLTDEEIELYSEKCKDTGNMLNCPVRPSAKDIKHIYKASMGK